MNARRIGPSFEKPPEPQNKDAVPQSKFTPAMLEALRKDVMSGRVPLGRVSISDDMQDGLRAMIRKTGLITFHAHYNVGDSRPYMMVGHYPDRPTGNQGQEAIDDARRLTKTIRALADKGIDVQDGLHSRLISELRRDGEKWRP